MPTPTPIWALVRRLSPGESCTHTTCRGPDYSLRFRRRAAGVYAEVLFKGKRGWRRHAIGRVPVSDAEVEAALRAFQCTQEEELYQGIADRALIRVRQLRAGGSPSGSFAAAVSDFLTIHGRGLAVGSRAEYRRHLERFSVRWGSRPLSALTYHDIETVFHVLTDAHGPVAANRALAALRSFLSWAVRTHRLTAAPIMPDTNSEQPRQRWLTDTELRRLWPALEALGYPTGSWCQLMLLTGTRREDAADLRWADIDDGTWQLRQKKSGALILIPLGPMARALLASLHKSGEYVFGGRRPLRGYGYRKQQVNRALGEPPLADWRFHDFRRTVRTNLSRLGVLPHVAELCIGHAPAGLIKVYDLHDFYAEKRAALEAWEGHLSSLHLTNS